MKNKISKTNRRGFLKKSSLIAVGTGSLLAFPQMASAQNQSAIEDINIVGPKEGFSPQIGTLVSMMNWMRRAVVRNVSRFEKEDLDFLLDDKANSTGAMLWHLAATERFYQIQTFEGRKWGDWDEKDKEEWGIPMGLGDKAREAIKGNDLDFYLKKLETVRNNTLEEFSKRDDDWLMAVDEEWGWGPTNNYCKWFHVCEHESNHIGQIKLIRSRLPSKSKDK